jgi:putative spermidine/putrescine transport system substrate-binding protein
MRKKRNHSTIAMASLVAAISANPAIAQSGEVTVAVGGGIVQEVGRETLWGPAGEVLGLTVNEETINNAYSAVQLQAAASAVTYDVVQANSFQAERGLAEGLFQPIDYSVVDASDFIEGTAPEHCISSLIFASVLAWNTNTYPDNPPQSWADFWDVENFPGTRAMRADAEAQLEVALMADGVPVEDVYEVLASEGGLERAIAKLEEIRPHVTVWWDSGAQHAQLMRDGEVDMAFGWNGRFESARRDGGPVDYTFNQGILGMDCWAVPADAPNPENAMLLINEMSKPEPQARFALGVSYIGGNARAYETGLIDEEAARLLPTHPDHAASMLVQQNAWWIENLEEAQLAFEEMMTR